MNKNLGNIDRVLRIVLSLVVAALLLTGTLSGTLGWILGVVAIVLLVTGAISFCPLYFPFKISTKKAEATAQPH